MKKQKSVFLLAGLLSLIVIIIATQSQNVRNLQFLLQTETPGDVAVAFSTALRLNDRIAYKVADPSLSSRIDDWMEINQIQKCNKLIDDTWGGRGVDGMYDIYFSCYLEDGSRYNFLVHRLQVKGLRQLSNAMIQTPISCFFAFV